MYNSSRTENNNDAKMTQCTPPIYAPKLGAQKGYLRLLDGQLRSVFHQVKIFPNDPKSLGHSEIGPNISKIIGPEIAEKFRAAYSMVDSFFDGGSSKLKRSCYKKAKSLSPPFMQYTI